MKSSDIPPGLFFILDGTASLTHPSDPITDIIKIGSGSYFGDSIFLLDTQYLNVM